MGDVYMMNERGLESIHYEKHACPWGEREAEFLKPFNFQVTFYILFILENDIVLKTKSISYIYRSV